MVSDRRRGWAALDTIRQDHQERRNELGVGPLDDRVIAWILRGELATPGRRLPGLAAAITRAMPRKPGDLRAIGGYVTELRSREKLRRETKV